MFKSYLIKPFNHRQPELFGFRLHLLRLLLIKSIKEYCLELELHPQLLKNMIRGVVVPGTELFAVASKIYGVKFNWLRYGKGDIFFKQGRGTPSISLLLDDFYYLDPLFLRGIDYLWYPGFSEKEREESVKMLIMYEEGCMQNHKENPGRHYIYSYQEREWNKP